MPKRDPEISRELGRKGGLLVREKYGIEYYSRIGLKGGRSYARKLRERAKNAKKEGE